jgi:hypothetical protein
MRGENHDFPNFGRGIFFASELDKSDFASDLRKVICPSGKVLRRRPGERRDP